MVKQKEIWKQVEGYENYEVSNLGNIFSKKMNKNLKASVLDGYLVVTLCNKGKRKSMRVHRVVAFAFISNPLNKPQINHKNLITTDNRVENLEWVTPKENVDHAIDNGVFSYKHCNKKIVQYDLEGNFIKEYDSLTEASKESGCTIAGICICAKGGQLQNGKWDNIKRSGKYIFKYKLTQTIK